MKPEKWFRCECGWVGPSSLLKKNGSVTYADEWWECPLPGCSGKGPESLTLIKEPKKAEPKRPCDGKCNQCPLINHPNSRLLSLILNRAFNKFGEELYNIVQSECPNMTGCWECHVDDFTHIEGCGLAEKANGKERG